jgi:hypothetical protein
MKLEWLEWNNSHLLRDPETNRNRAWVQRYPDLGYSVQLWNRAMGKYGDWERIAYAPELEAAKLIAQLNVHQ